MPRTLSKTARARKTEELRQEFPYLEDLLDAFRDNGFRSEDVIALISKQREGGGMPGPLAKKYSSLSDEQKNRVNGAATLLCEAYAEFFETRRQNGAALKAKDVMEGLRGDIHKICNFTHATPYHKARQGMEGYLHQRAQGVDTVVEQSAEKPEKDDKTPPKTQLDKDDSLKLTAAAGTVTGLVAASQAVKSWRDRVKQPEAKKKAVAFASVAAVSAVGVAAALFLGRGGGISR